jgi:hypothetical protein
MTDDDPAVLVFRGGAHATLYAMVYVGVALAALVVCVLVRWS